MGGPQFPDTPEGRAARRELSEWVFANNGPDARHQRDLLARIQRLTEENRNLAEERRVLAEQRIQDVQERQALIALMQSQVDTQRLLSATLAELATLQHRAQTVIEPQGTVLSDYEHERDALPGLNYHTPAWRQWETFRAAMVDACAAVAVRPGNADRFIRRDWLVNEINGGSGKNVSRAMVDYGLPLALWPPNLWPVHDPRTSVGRRELTLILERNPHLSGRRRTRRHS